MSPERFPKQLLYYRQRVRDNSGRSIGRFMIFEDGTGQQAHTMEMIMIALLSVNLILWHIDPLLGNG
jgi:hypothetical protein